MELANRSLLQIIKKKLNYQKAFGKKICQEYYGPTRPLLAFILTYRTEAVIPVKMGALAPCVVNFTQKNNEGKKLDLDLLEGKREEARLRMEAYKQKIANYYNAKVRPRRFIPGDLILMKILSGAKDPQQGKLHPNWEGLFHITGS